MPGYMRRFLKSILASRGTRKMPFYAVARGKSVGIYNTWDECKAQVNGFPDAKFKKFSVKTEAEEFIRANGKENLRKETKSDVKSDVKKPLQPYLDFWPDDISDGEEDNFLLAAVASKFDAGTVGQAVKRKAYTQEVLIEMLKKIKKESIVYKAVGQKTYGNQSFPVDAEGHVLVYTDGSCEGNGRRNAIAGIGVYFDDNHPLNVGKAVCGRATNNTGEIQAACEAIRIAARHNVSKLCINTDSQFLIHSVTKWMRSWKRNNWKLGNGQHIKNLDDYTILDKLIIDNPMQIRWNYVRGHRGIKGNEAADRLAKQGAQLYKRKK